MNKQDWIKHFPYTDTRPSQETSINFALEQFKRKKFVIIEAPTGSGKSAIGITVAKMIGSSYIVTTQKILQMQYTKDYPWLANLWSKTNYKCKARPNLSCDTGLMINKSTGFSPCKCHYKEDKEKYLRESISLTNLPYFLNVVEHFPMFSKRDLLIIDEAHNLDDQLTNFVSLEIHRGEMEQHDILWPKKNLDLLSIKNWISKDVLPILERKIETKKNIMSEKKAKFGASFASTPEGQTLLKQIDFGNKLVTNITRFIYNSANLNEWVMTRSYQDDEILIRPIYSSKFAEQCLYRSANKVLLMSGTILDKNTYCKNVGIPIDNVAFISLDSEFHKDNRPVMITNVASMSYKNIDKSLPTMVKAIKGIINDPQHKDVKGIIHTSSFKVANYIKENLKDKRLLFHTSEDKIEIYKQHILSDSPTILVSPSMGEGVDLLDDLSRFQIIVKIPFASLGDEYVKTKMTRVKGWYDWLTVKSIIQSSGRSVRDKNDWSITYILDSDWSYFYYRTSKFFPKWYKESIIKL